MELANQTPLGRYVEPMDPAILTQAYEKIPIDLVYNSIEDIKVLPNGGHESFDTNSSQISFDHTFADDQYLITEESALRFNCYVKADNAFISDSTSVSTEPVPSFIKSATLKINDTYVEKQKQFGKALYFKALKYWGKEFIMQHGEAMGLIPDELAEGAPQHEIPEILLGIDAYSVEVGKVNDFDVAGVDNNIVEGAYKYAPYRTRILGGNIAGEAERGATSAHNTTYKRPASYYDIRNKGCLKRHKRIVGASANYVVTYRIPLWAIFGSFQAMKDANILLPIRRLEVDVVRMDSLYDFVKKIAAQDASDLLKFTKIELELKVGRLNPLYAARMETLKDKAMLIPFIKTYTPDENPALINYAGTKAITTQQNFQSPLSINHMFNNCTAGSEHSTSLYNLKHVSYTYQSLLCGGNNFTTYQRTNDFPLYNYMNAYEDWLRTLASDESTQMSSLVNYTTYWNMFPIIAHTLNHDYRTIAGTPYKMDSLSKNIIQTINTTTAANTRLTTFIEIEGLIQVSRNRCLQLLNVSL